MTKKIAVVVLTYKGYEFAEKLYNSLLNQKTRYNFHIYLIDNGSIDNTVGFVREKFPEVKIITFSEGLRFAKGLNRAVKLLKYDYLALLNDDVYLDPNWLEELINTITKDEKIAIVNSRIMYWDFPKFISSSGAKITFWGGHSHNLEYKDINECSLGNSKITGSFQGSSLLINREIFIKMGGFDGLFVNQNEEPDLSWRIWIAGYRIVYNPNSIVYHKIGASVASDNLYFKEYNLTKNRMMTILKNAHKIFLPFSILVSLSFDFFEILRKKDKKLAVRSKFNSYKYILNNFGIIINKRSAIQHLRVIDDKKLLEMGLFLKILESIRYLIENNRNKRIWNQKNN